MKLDVRKYFEENSPAALQDMTGVMLEAIRKDLWKADAETARQIAEAHVELMKKFDMPPLPNEKLQEMIRKSLRNQELREAFERQVKKSLELRKARDERIKKQDEKISGMKLKAQQPESSPDGDTRAALKMIALIVLAGLLSIVLGNFFRKRRKSGK